MKILEKYIGYFLEKNYFRRVLKIVVPDHIPSLVGVQLLIFYKKVIFAKFQTSITSAYYRILVGMTQYWEWVMSNIVLNNIILNGYKD